MLEPYHRATAGIRRIPDLPVLIARVVGGGLFIDHGLQKYHMKGGLTSFQFFLKSLKNIPATSLTAQVVPALEVVGGVLLIVGLLTRLVALLLAAEMVVTGFVVKLNDLSTGVVSGQGAGAEVDFIYLALFLVILLLGPGRASLDAAFGLERHSTKRTSDDTLGRSPETAGARTV